MVRGRVPEAASGLLRLVHPSLTVSLYPARMALSQAGSHSSRGDLNVRCAYGSWEGVAPGRECASEEGRYVTLAGPAPRGTPFVRATLVGDGADGRRLGAPGFEGRDSIGRVGDDLPIPVA